MSYQSIILNFLRYKLFKEELAFPMIIRQYITVDSKISDLAEARVSYTK